MKAFITTRLIDQYEMLIWAQGEQLGTHYWDPPLSSIMTPVYIYLPLCPPHFHTTGRPEGICQCASFGRAIPDGAGSCGLQGHDGPTLVSL